MIGRVLLQYVGGMIFSVIGFLFFSEIYRLLEMAKLDPDFWGDKANILFGLFFGLSIGGTLGVVLIEKFIYKALGWNILAIILALLLACLGNFVGLWMMDKVGGGFVYYIPLLVTFMCVLGYNIGMLVK